MKKRRTFFSLLLTLLLLVAFSSAAAAETTEDWIVCFDSARYSKSEIQAVAAEYDLKYLLNQYYATDAATAAQLEGMPMVLSVGASATATLCDVKPSAPMYNDPGFEKQWGLQLVNIEDCWRYYTTGSKDVVVCVIDSGFYVNHEDAQKNFKSGKDYVTEDPDDLVTFDNTSHGTSCAGLIGATSDNGIGITGLLKDVTVVNQRTFYWDDVAQEKKADLTKVVEAIGDAVELYNADVISMSFLFEPQNDADLLSLELLKAACDDAREKGVILVAAAGNNGFKDSALQYPAAFDSVIGVGAVDSDGVVADFSAKNNSVFCCAPGKDIYSLGNYYNAESDKQNYRLVSGTSLATPFVASLGALARSFDPEITPDEFRSLLKTTSKDLGEVGYDTSYGYGLIDCEKLLKRISDKKDGNVFNDISKESWYYDSVMTVFRNHLMVGLEKDSFGPDVNLSRSMFVTILYRMEGEPAVEGDTSFIDVAADGYYRNAVIWGEQNKIVYGVGDDKVKLFAPDAPISRQEVVTMLYRYYKDYKKVTLPDKGASADFTDDAQIDTWAKDAVTAMVKAGILEGYKLSDGTYVFKPRVVATRAVAARIISGLYTAK